MKKCSVFLFLLVTLAAVGQKEYRIEGKVRNAAGNTVVQLLVWAGNMGKVFVEGDSALYGNLSFWVGEPLTKIEGDEPCVALWKVKSKLRQQQEENRFVKNSARITREYERVRFDKEDEYVAEYKDQHSKHPKMKDYPVTRLFDSLSALKAEADLKILEEQAVLWKDCMSMRENCVHPNVRQDFGKGLKSFICAWIRHSKLLPGGMKSTFIFIR